MNIPEHIIENVVMTLNEALACDREGVSLLMNSRVAVNEALALHPTIQVGESGHAFTLGPLGLINGILGEDPQNPGWGYIGMEVDISDNDRVLRFIRMPPMEPPSGR